MTDFNTARPALIMLKSFARGNKEIIIKLIRVFLRNTPDMLNELENNFLNYNSKVVQQSIHKLASQFTFMNFDEGEKILLQLKECNENENPDSKAMLILVEELKSICDTFYELLNAEIIRLE